ncbi:MAG: tetratricopeptide repeat protein [Desulfobacteraceae bacterium]|nr:tetratricopeptide repeat protein [Desulfobacteraceae bacterium]MBU4053547.1 tetratricopeptide repeat protein [Pseudomonadota bacterium]
MSLKRKGTDAIPPVTAQVLLVVGLILASFCNPAFPEDNTVYQDAAKSGADEGHRSSRMASYRGDKFQYYLNKGFEAYMQNDLEQAIENYSNAVKIKRSPIFLAYFNRGSAYLKKGDYNAAIDDFTKVLELKPDLISAYLSRGNTWIVKGNTDKALEDFTLAIAADPTWADAYVNRGTLWFKLGEFEMAWNDLAKSIQIQENSPSCLVGAAHFLATCPDEKFRNGPLAVELSRKAIQLTHGLKGMVKTPSSPEVMTYTHLALAPQYDALAAGLAETGDFKGAVEAQTQAISLLEAENAAHKIPEYTARLKSYEEKKPRREIPVK